LITINISGNGADASIKDDFGNTAAVYASEKRQKDIHGF